MPCLCLLCCQTCCSAPQLLNLQLTVSCLARATDIAHRQDLFFASWRVQNFGSPLYPLSPMTFSSGSKSSFKFKRKMRISGIRTAGHGPLIQDISPVLYTVPTSHLKAALLNFELYHFLFTSFVNGNGSCIRKSVLSTTRRHLS